MECVTCPYIWTVIITVLNPPFLCYLGLAFRFLWAYPFIILWFTFAQKQKLWTVNNYIYSWVILCPMCIHIWTSLLLRVSFQISLSLPIYNSMIHFCPEAKSLNRKNLYFFEYLGLAFRFLWAYPFIILWFTFAQKRKVWTVNHYKYILESY